LNRVQLAVCHLLKLLYPAPPQPNKALTFAERNMAIRERHAAGESLSQLARAFDISSQRVQQIIKHRRK
jgi:Mor family transcriptional regulator